VSSQKEKAEKLRAMHETARPLVLVNAWDVVSARIIEDLGFPAVATTSAGVAWAEGFADGERISREQMLARVKRIAQAVNVPLTADLEGGYGYTVRDAEATARGAIEAGAVGLNFEDAYPEEGALIDLELQTARIAAIREIATKLDVPLVVNARTDTFLAGIGDSDAWRLKESIRRGNEYLRAGADVVFVPGVTDEPTITTLVSNIGGPINVLAGTATPSVERLRDLGVARVSVGSGAFGYVLARFREVAAGLRDGGTFEFVGQRIPHAELNAVLDNVKAHKE
jgi:2-methylisocitrate lyase-like PEP mutase family enzyme